MSAMGYLQLGRYTPHLQVTDVGPIDFTQALKELDNCFAAAGVNYADAETHLAATTLFVSRTDADFLDISCPGNNTVLILSDRVCSTRQSVWHRWLFRTKSVFSMEIDKSTAQKVISDYFTLSREDFEQTYQRYLTS
jgi:hypothetical protein